MNWTEVSPYAERCGAYTIARYRVERGRVVTETFLLHRGTLDSGDLKNLGHFGTIGEAKAAAAKDASQ